MKISIPKTLEVFVASKNREGKYTYCNEKVAEVLGLDSSSSIIGKTDHDLCWRDQAEIYIAGDHKVMNGEEYSNVIEPQTQESGLRKILISKVPTFDAKDNCTGIIATYVDITDYFIRKKKIKIEVTSNNKFFLGPKFGNTYLTQREVQVLQGLLQGLCAKKIGDKLKISSRTVEQHIASLKKKLQCTTKCDIIMTSIRTGLNFSILDML